jgi:putative endonuclease
MVARRAAGSCPAHIAAGRLGEEAACAYLAASGMRILARNWRAGHLELDIIAQDNGTIVFAEVKTRAAQGLESPHEALTPAKRSRLVRAAGMWLSSNDMWDRPCRFDLVCVTTEARAPEPEQMSLQAARAAGTAQARRAAGSGLPGILGKAASRLFGAGSPQRSHRAGGAPDSPEQLLRVEHIPHAFDLSESLGGGDAAWQPW